MNEPKLRTIIVGAGKAGELLEEDLRKNSSIKFEIVGFVDDDITKHGKQIGRVRVLGTVSDLNRLVDEEEIDEILIAAPSQRGELVRAVIENTIDQRVTYKLLPNISEVLIQDFKSDYIKFIRRVRPEDLLGGQISKADQAEITKYSKGQTILITGAAGSIGSELSRQLAAHNAEKIVFYDWWENGMFELKNQLMADYPKGKFEFIIGDVKDRKKLSLIMQEYKPTTVFHAAAYKHVPLMEHNPVEAIKNNIVGTRNVAELAIRHGAKKFILISTDKAVNPTNIMGATKRAAEKVIHILAESQSNTTLCAVRFGNVINSNGSAIPIFEKQIERGGPVTVTHKDITRYFMTIPEAVHLVLQSWVMGQNNDLFVLDMDKPIKIYDLARLLIATHGYIPDQDIDIKITGLRPGEKLYEEVLVKEEETASTPIEKVFRTQNYMSFDKLAFVQILSQLIEDIDDGMINIEDIKPRMKKLISTYKPKD